MAKRPLGIDVLTAARGRIARVFDDFPRIYVSFSGGKDSTVLLHLVMEEAVRRGRKVGLLFLDWECQFAITIDHVRRMYQLYAEHVEPYWIALPIRTWNGCSQFEAQWTAWDPAKRDLWVRQPDAMSITDPDVFPFYTPSMMFEEFMPAFGEWYGGGKLTASLVGIRTAESLNRFRTLVRDKQTFDGLQWTTYMAKGVYSAYPIYDWTAEDDWTYIARAGKPYNTLYDRMHQAGLSIHQMRIDEPFGDTQRKGLWLYHVIEPETWARMTARVAGANTGELYAGEAGNVLGNLKVSLPAGHTWQSFAALLLDTMPPTTGEHYRNKIAVYLRWYQVRGFPDGLPDCQEDDTGAKDVPSWRRICKVLLRNDYWCRGLSFSPTKTQAYERYCKIMKKRRQSWNLAW